MALLAHQLRTPLSTISALAQGLTRRADRMSSKDVKERADKIWRASLRVHELIETIMSYTRLNAGAISLNPSQFNLKALVRRVCHDQSSHEPERPFHLQLHDLPEDFLGDPILLEQALVIVLSNAMKYSPQDRPIDVVSRTSSGIVTITIEDHGVGISERDLPFLTQPFFRGQNTRDVPGTGLGLSLAWHIVRLHGGSLHIRNREAGGTSVAMLLSRNNVFGLGNGI